MARRFDAVVFDLDGTLLDTLQDLADASNAVLAELGFPQHPVPAYREFVGSGVRVLFERCLPPDARRDEVIDRCAELFREHYGRHWNRNTRPYPEVPELLDALAARGIAMAVLSNKPHEFTRRCVEEFLPRWSFAVVLGQTDTRPRKPDPAAALEIAERIGVGPQRVAYVGDTSVDMQTARNAGMFPVGATWGFRSAEELKQHGAAALAHRPLELLRVVDAS
ncbi:MAG: HAD family hydrolase [Planctomycetota bacterium]|nr:MAG: HAD family hydrolase [Planctomycetota bacterium]